MKVNKVGSLSDWLVTLLALHGYEGDGLGDSAPAGTLRKMLVEKQKFLTPKQMQLATQVRKELEK